MKKIVWNVIFIVLCIPTFIKVTYWTVINSIRRKMKPKMKLVQFENYCKICAHKYVPGIDEPCYTCLANKVNENSHKPVSYIPMEKDKEYKP